MPVSLRLVVQRIGSLPLTLHGWNSHLNGPGDQSSLLEDVQYTPCVGDLPRGATEVQSIIFMMSVRRPIATLPHSSLTLQGVGANKDPILVLR